MVDRRQQRRFGLGLSEAKLIEQEVEDALAATPA